MAIDDDDDDDDDDDGGRVVGRHICRTLAGSSL